MTDYETLVRAACKQAVRVERGRRHIKIWGPKGMTTIAQTSMKGRASRGLANTRAALRRIGIVLVLALALVACAKNPGYDHASGRNVTRAEADADHTVRDLLLAVGFVVGLGVLLGSRTPKDR